MIFVQNKGHNRISTLYKRTFVFDSKGRGIYDKTLCVQEPLRDVKIGSHSAQPTTSIALMFMQRKTELFWFYWGAFDLVLSVCWQPFNTAPQVQDLTNQAQVGQRAWVRFWATNVWLRLRKPSPCFLFLNFFCFLLRHISMAPLLVPVLPHNPYLCVSASLWHTEALEDFWKAAVFFSHMQDSDINSFKVHLLVHRIRGCLVNNSKLSLMQVSPTLRVFKIKLLTKASLQKSQESFWGLIKKWLGTTNFVT